MSPTIRAVVVTGQVLAALLCILVLISWRGPELASDLTGEAYSLWQSLIALVAFGVIAITLSFGAVRSALVLRLLMSIAALMLTLLVLDVIPLHTRVWWVADAALFVMVGLLLPANPPRWDVIRFVIVSLPFVMAFAAAVGSPGATQSARVLRDPQWAAFAAWGLSLLATSSVVSAIQSQRKRSERLLKWHITRRAVMVAVGLKFLLIVAFYLRLTGDFVGGEAHWRPRLDQPLSWVHAAIVAGIIVLATAASVRLPVTSGAFTTRLAILAFTLGVVPATALLTSLAAMVIKAVSPITDSVELTSFPLRVNDHLEMIQLITVAVLFTSAVVTVLIRRRLTSGTYLWLVSGTWLIPPLVGIAYATESSPTAWAAPGQVDAVLTAVVLVMFVTGRSKSMSPRALMGLVLVPLVVLHLGNALPDDWTQRLTPVAVVAVVVIALWLNPPPVAPDRLRNERVRVLLLAGNLTLLVPYFYFLDDAALAAKLGFSSTLALLWFGVPITAVLTAQIGHKSLQSFAATGEPTPQSWQG